MEVVKALSLTSSSVLVPPLKAPAKRMVIMRNAIKTA